jgi:hypothetical protein
MANEAENRARMTDALKSLSSPSVTEDGMLLVPARPETEISGILASHPDTFYDRRQGGHLSIAHVGPGGDVRLLFAENVGPGHVFETGGGAAVVHGLRNGFAIDENVIPELKARAARIAAKSLESPPIRTIPGTAGRTGGEMVRPVASATPPWDRKTSQAPPSLSRPAAPSHFGRDSALARWGQPPAEGELHRTAAPLVPLAPAVVAEMTPFLAALMAAFAQWYQRERPPAGSDGAPFIAPPPQLPPLPGTPPAEPLPPLPGTSIPDEKDRPPASAGAPSDPVPSPPHESFPELSPDQKRQGQIVESHRGNDATRELNNRTGRTVEEVVKARRGKIEHLGGGHFGHDITKQNRPERQIPRPGHVEIPAGRTKNYDRAFPDMYYKVTFTRKDGTRKTFNIYINTVTTRSDGSLIPQEEASAQRVMRNKNPCDIFITVPKSLGQKPEGLNGFRDFVDDVVRRAKEDDTGSVGSTRHHFPGPSSR